MTLQIVQDEAADELLSTNSFALLCGMLLQQQVPVEVAFSGPAKLFERFGSLDPATIGAASPEDFAKLCATEPPIHPYPESMSVLIQAVARFIVTNYGGDTASLWETAGSGPHLLSRVMLLPGFNKRQAQMFVALLGKQLGVRPPGWEEAAGQFGQPDIHRSVADVRDAESLEKVQSAKSKRSKGHHDSDGPHDPTSSSTNKSSKGLGQVTDEEIADQAERSGARKAARKAAKRAANQAARQETAGDTESTEGADGADGADGAARGGGRTGAKRAGQKAKKAAKRAARREARANDPDAPARKGGGRNAEGRAAKKAARSRKRAEAAAGGGDTGEETSSATDAEATDGVTDPTATGNTGDQSPPGGEGETPQDHD